MTAFVVILGVFLIAYELAFHKNLRLKLACFASGLFYFLYAFLDVHVETYGDGYVPYMVVDAAWLALLIYTVAPRLSVAAITASIVWTIAALQWPNHWFLYGYHTELFITLHTTFVLSLTVLPAVWPRIFGLPYSEKDDGSFFRLFSLAVVKDAVRLRLRSPV